MSEIVVETWVLPSQIAPQSEEIAAALNEAFQLDDQVEASAETPQTMNLSGVEVVAIAILSTSFHWFTKQWAKEYLWPLVKKKIDRKSREIIDFLDDKIPE